VSPSTENRWPLVVDIFGIGCGVFDTFEGHDKNGKFSFENALHKKKILNKKVSRKDLPAVLWVWNDFFRICIGIRILLFSWFLILLRILNEFF
jgi:hypothetical protein